MDVNDFNPFKKSAKDKGFLNSVNRSTYDNNREFLTTGLWDIKFTKIPAAVYFPGNETIASRILSVDAPNPMVAKLLEYNHRDFVKIQPSARVPRNGEVTLTFTDFEDQSIVAWINNWAYSQSDPETNMGYRSEYLKCDLILTRLNTSGNPVNEITCKSGYLKSPRFANDYSDKQDLLAKQSFTISFEYITFKLLNT